MSTFNPSDKSATITLSNGNLTATSSTAVSQSARSTTSYASGKIYFEATMTTKTNDWTVGIANSTEGLAFGGGSGLGADGNGSGFYPISPAQQTYYNGVPVGAGGGSASVNGAVISIAADFTNHKLWISTAVMRAASQSWNNSATDNPSTSTGGNSFTGLTGPYFVMFNDDLGGAVCVVNFGATAFNQSIPTGFTSWDTGSVATASGTGTATGVGNSAAASVGTATGTGTDTGTGNSAAASVGTATGSGTATAVGNSLAKSVGTATGSGTDTATGNSAALSVGSASGTGSASGVGNSAALSVGSATGSSTAPATGNSAATSVGTATGSGTDTGTGNSAAASVGSASGTGTAAGVSAQSASTGTATGSGSAAGVGNSAAAAVGGASGQGAASGAGASSGDVTPTTGGPGDSNEESQKRPSPKKRKPRVAKKKIETSLPDQEVETPGLTQFVIHLDAARQAEIDDEEDVAVLLALAI